jgi:hypothetical protein
MVAQEAVRLDMVCLLPITNSYCSTSGFASLHLNLTSDLRPSLFSLLPREITVYIMSAIRRVNRRSARDQNSSPYSRPTASKNSVRAISSLTAEFSNQDLPIIVVAHCRNTHIQHSFSIIQTTSFPRPKLPKCRPEYVPSHWCRCLSVLARSFGTQTRFSQSTKPSK